MSRIDAGTFPLAALVALAACGRDEARPLRNDAYVWQRAWTPAVVAAVKNHGAQFDGLRILAADGETVMDAPQGVKRAVAVVRLEGSRPPELSTVVATLDDVKRRWREAHVDVAGVEIDHDCATSRLADYAVLLRAIREHLATPARLSITALPTWTGSGELRTVLEAVDQVVLQVHAVDRPSLGLFDPKRALRAIHAFAKETPTPFVVALPAYGVGRGLRANPVDVAHVAHALRRDPPRHLAGVVWFRLPVEGDVGAWDIGTLEAVRAGGLLRPVVRVRLEGTDVVAENVGPIEAVVPATIAVHVAGGRIVGADGVAGFEWDTSDPEAGALVARKPPHLAPGARMVVGWVRAEQQHEVTVDAR